VEQASAFRHAHLEIRGREILTLLFRPEYAERADLSPGSWLPVLFCLWRNFWDFGMTAAGFYHSQVYLNILANVSLVAACYWLVAAKGLLGAILAMLIAAIVQLLASVVILAAAMRNEVQCSNGNARAA